MTGELYGDFGDRVDVEGRIQFVAVTSRISGDAIDADCIAAAPHAVNDSGTRSAELRAAEAITCIVAAVAVTRADNTGKGAQQTERIAANRHQRADLLAVEYSGARCGFGLDRRGFGNDANLFGYSADREIKVPRGQPLRCTQLQVALLHA